MGMTTVGAARVVFSADTTDFDASAKGIEGVIGRLREKFAELESHLKRLGAGMTLGVTLPFAGMVRAVDKGAGGFEAAMKRVQAALDGVTTRQLEQLSQQARTLGPAVGKGATEAAGGIEALGLAGVSTSEILGGGLKATLDLAAAGQADVAESAGLVTDAMGQFHLTAAQLPDVVRQVVGSLDASKFGFQDFQLAIAQGGGIAAASGVSFRDFSTAIAATSSQFSSGADAGTSFKTYLQSLNPQSKAAAAAMKALGLEFFDASGKMKPLADQAAMLREKLGDLTDKSKSDALNTIFGADAARTAIGLISQGREGIEQLTATIEKGDVSGKIAKSMEGSAAASQRIANAWESVKISLGDTGLLDAVTTLKNGFAGLLESFANAPPMILKITATFAALGAAIGPALLVIGNLAAVILPLVAARFGILGFAISAIVNPFGTAAVAAVRLISAFSGAMILGKVVNLFISLGSAVMSFATPVGLAIGALTLFIYIANSSATATEGMTKATEAVSASLDAYEEAANAAATATGKERVEALKNAAAKREEARQTIVATQAKLMYAKMDLDQMRLQAARAARVEQRSGVPYADRRVESVGQSRLSQGFEGVGQADITLAEKSLTDATKRFTAANKILAAANAPLPQLRSIDLSGGDDGKPKKGRTAAANAVSYDRDNREQLEMQAQLEAARLKNDEATVRALQDRLDLSRQVEAYQRTGLSLADATKTAERDMALLGAARAQQSAREIATDQRRQDMRVAELAGNGQLGDQLERQEHLEERIAFWRSKGKSDAEATALATAEQVRLDGAVADARERASRAAEASRQIELARARGDSEESIRRMESATEVDRRAQELMRGGDDRAPMDEASARAQAETEAMQMETARRQGIFRDTIKGGFRAALDGNFGDWFQNWWKDRVAKGMEDALNKLSDLIMNLFSKAGSQSGGGGQGGGIGSVLSGLFGGGSGGGGDAGSSALASLLGQGNGSPQPVDISGAPGFKTGGRFKVGGMSGIDRNLVAFRATAGEMVSITHGEPETGPAGASARIEIVEHPAFASRVVSLSDGVTVSRIGQTQRGAARQSRARLA